MTPLVSELADRAETCTGIFQLAVGRYALFCDILKTEAEGAKENRYANGTRSAFEVRG